MKFRNLLRGVGSILNIMPKPKRLSFNWSGGNIVPGQINSVPIRTSLQVQVTATITTPCCRKVVTLARHFNGGQVEYPIQWAGVACPKCQTTWAIKLERET